MTRIAWYAALAILSVASGCQKAPLASQPSPLKVAVRRFERVVPGCGDQERLVQPCFSFQVSYPEVTTAAEPEAQAKLNARILALLQPAGAPAGFENEAERLVGQYHSQPRGVGTEDGEPAWFVRRSAEVIHSTAAALAVRVERTEYLGGPAATTAYECVNLNPATGEEYRLPDLLIPRGEDRLRTIAEARFRLEQKIPEGRLLSEAGYTFLEDRFSLPQQFLLVKHGIEFVFNSNEISKDGRVGVNLIVPWADISGLIRIKTGVVPVP